jgi:hypothetical protein
VVDHLEGPSDHRELPAGAAQRREAASTPQSRTRTPRPAARAAAGRPRRPRRLHLTPAPAARAPRRCAVADDHVVPAAALRRAAEAAAVLAPAAAGGRLEWAAGSAPPAGQAAAAGCSEGSRRLPHRLVERMFLLSVKFRRVVRPAPAGRMVPSLFVDEGRHQCRHRTNSLPGEPRPREDTGSGAPVASQGRRPCCARYGNALNHQVVGGLTVCVIIGIVGLVSGSSPRQLAEPPRPQAQRQPNPLRLNEGSRRRSRGPTTGVAAARPPPTLYAYTGPNSHIHDGQYPLGESLTVVCQTPTAGRSRSVPTTGGRTPPRPPGTDSTTAPGCPPSMCTSTSNGHSPPAPDWERNRCDVRPPLPVLAWVGSRGRHNGLIRADHPPDRSNAVPDATEGPEAFGPRHSATRAEPSSWGTLWWNLDLGQNGPSVEGPDVDDLGWACSSRSSMSAPTLSVVTSNRSRSVA